MTLSNTLRMIGGALLAVVTLLQLEVGVSHVLHIVLSCVAVGLSYLLGYKTEPPSNKPGQVQL